MRSASNRYAFGFCDRTGFRYPLNDLVDEYKNGVKTGLRVGRDVADDDHPQNFLGRVRIFDPQNLTSARPDRSLQASRQLFGFNPVWNPAQFMTASVGRVTVDLDTLGTSAAVSGVSATTSVGAVDASAFTAQAFAQYIPFSKIFLAIAVFLFAISTMISWSYYGLQSWKFIFGRGKRADLLYKLLFLMFIVIGAASSMKSIWDFSDAMIFAMIFPNMIGLFFLFPEVRKELIKYLKAIKK